MSTEERDEWATLMAFEAHQCFVAGSDIATIILCASCCEAHLKNEYGSKNDKFFALIENSPIASNLKLNLHKLRLSRNNWVHLKASGSDEELECFSHAYTPELEEQAKFAYRTMLAALFENPFT